MFHWALWPLYIKSLSVLLALLALAPSTLAQAALSLLALLLEVDLAAGAGGEVCGNNVDSVKMSDKSASLGKKG